MPDGFILRILIDLALGIPSFLLWLVLYLIAKHRGISVAGMADWLKVVLFVVLGLNVIFSAMNKNTLASGLSINFWGVFLALNWVQRRSKLNERAPTVLNISGRE